MKPYGVPKRTIEDDRPRLDKFAGKQKRTAKKKARQHKIESPNDLAGVKK